MIFLWTFICPHESKSFLAFVISSSSSSQCKRAFAAGYRFSCSEMLPSNCNKKIHTEPALGCYWSTFSPNQLAEGIAGIAIKKFKKNVYLRILEIPKLFNSGNTSFMISKSLPQHYSLFSLQLSALCCGTGALRTDNYTQYQSVSLSTYHIASLKRIASAISFSADGSSGSSKSGRISFLARRCFTFTATIPDTSTSALIFWSIFSVSIHLSKSIKSTLPWHLSFLWDSPICCRKLSELVVEVERPRGDEAQLAAPPARRRVPGFAQELGGA